MRLRARTLGVAVPAAALGVTLGKAVGAGAGATTSPCIAFGTHSVRQHAQLLSSNLGAGDIYHYNTSTSCPSQSPGAAANALREKNEYHLLSPTQGDVVCYTTGYDVNTTGDYVAGQGDAVADLCGHNKTYYTASYGANSHSGNWTTWRWNSTSDYIP